MMALAALGGALAGPPAAVVQLELQRGGRPWPVVLTLTRSWEHRALDPAAAQRDELTTALEPSVHRQQDTTTMWFTGYRLSGHEQPGDTLVTCALLVSTGPGGELRGFWYEDHMEVPTTLYTVTGHLEGRRIDLTMAELTDPGIPAATIEARGLVWRR